MEIIPTSLKKSRRLLLAFLALSVMPLGCVSMSEWWSAKKGDPAEIPAPARMMVYWAPNVGFAPDAHQDGRPVAGFAGRLFLFTKGDGGTLPPDGTLTVTVHNPKERDEDGDLKAVQFWTLPPKTLKKLVTEDLFGQSVSLFLPWMTYRPDIDQVVLRAKYVTKSGVPLFHNSGLLRLGSMKVVKPPVVKQSTRVVKPKVLENQYSRTRIEIPARPTRQAQ